MNWMIILMVIGAGAMNSGTPSDSSQSNKKTEQVVREESFELDTSADRAFQFFTPEGEKTWVKGWNPISIYPPQAAVEFKTNSVFRVDQEGERSLWTIVEANLQEHIAEYVYVVEGERLSRVRARIQPLSEGRCRVSVHYVHTATSEKGVRFVLTVTEGSYAQKMKDWQHMVSVSIR